ncbi:MAG: CPBP family intramembrane glutamic endopeptidase [Myxococcota bacterium]
MNERAIGRAQAGWELALFALAGGTFVVSVLLDVPRRWAIGTLVIALLVYVVILRRRGAETLHDFGVRTDNLRVSLREVGIFTLLAALAMVVYALAMDVSLQRPEMLVLLPLYPLYGVAQQLAVQGVLHRRALRVSGNPNVALVVTAVGFGLLHAGNPPLLALTTLAGFAWSWLYRRHPNVLTLGLSHGVLAALAYPLMLGTNPLLNV